MQNHYPDKLSKFFRYLRKVRYIYVVGIIGQMCLWSSSLHWSGIKSIPRPRLLLPTPHTSMPYTRFWAKKEYTWNCVFPTCVGMNRLQWVLSFLYYCVDLYICLNWRGTASICDRMSFMTCRRRMSTCGCLILLVQKLDGRHRFNPILFK